MNAHDTTEDRVATLHALLNDAAAKVGEQRLLIRELVEALGGIIADDDAGVSLNDQRARWNDRMTAAKAAVLKATGA